jgi:FkbM family methyltransferase
VNLDLEPLPNESEYETGGHRLHHSTFNPEWLVNPKVILDVGAWDFGDSIRLKQKFPECQVHAFELLQSNFDKFSPFARECGVITNGFAVSDTDGIVEFYEGRHSDGHNAQSSLLKPSNIYKSHYSHIVQHEDKPKSIKATRLDTYCSNFGIYTVDLLHVDVEGAEHKIFSSLGELRPKLIFAEFLFDGGWEGQVPFLETFELLKSMGYKLVKNHGADKLYAHSAA